MHDGLWAPYLVKPAFGSIVRHFGLCSLLQLIKGFRVYIHLVSHPVGHTVLDERLAISRQGDALFLSSLLLQ